jgi:hypothetical protein
VSEPSRVKVARHRAHKRGDHRTCLARNCERAGTVERDDVRALRQAIEAEFAGDRMRLAIARRQVELAAGSGPAAGGALRDLGQTVEARRRGELAPADGRTAIDAELRELLDEVVDLEVARRLTELVGRQWLGPGGRPLPALIDELMVEIRGAR